MCQWCLQVQTALGAVLRNATAREQPCGVFGSFGWSGEAVDEMEGRLKVAPHGICTALQTALAAASAFTCRLVAGSQRRMQSVVQETWFAKQAHALWE